MKKILFLSLLWTNIVHAQIKQIDSTLHLTVVPPSIIVSTGNNTANMDFTGYATNTVLNGVATLVSTNQANIAVLQSQVKSLGAGPLPRSLTTNTTLSASDNGGLLLVDKSITITFPSNLPNDFKCSIEMRVVGTLTFAGNFHTKNGRKTVTAQFAWVDIHSEQNGYVNLNW